MTNNYRTFSLSNLPQVREKVYDSYRTLLKIGSQGKLIYPRFLDRGNIIFCSDSIKLFGEEVAGKTCLAGMVLSREDIGNGYAGYVISSERGIEMFENYSGKFRAAIASGTGLVIDRAALEKAAKVYPDELQGHSIEEVIGINFELFPVIINNSRQLSREANAMAYLKSWSKNPILF